MKNVCIFSFAKQGFQELCQLEAAKTCYDNGDNVLFVTCGLCVGICNDNTLGNKLQCKLCKNRQRARLHKYVAKDVNTICLDDLCSKELYNKSEHFIFNIHNVEQLKAYTYEGVEIGYAALSSYISYTRNIDLIYEGKVKEYIEQLMRFEIRCIDIAKKIFSEFKPDKVIVHNGRYAIYKPFYGLAKAKNVEYITTESITSSNGIVMRNDYHNSIPHDIYANNEKFKLFWEDYPDKENRERDAKLFFENRKNAVFAGDTIYVKDQKLGKLPANWNKKNENIVIFNSSEDEFFAIGSEYENISLFKSQISGIKTIVEHYINDDSKHFTLRVHPHLKGLEFSYHKDLYKLNYPNLTVVPAESDISSYSLLDAADKVIVFGSTMGVESAFWGKPTINLAYALYRDMDVVYLPKSLEELWHLLDSKTLMPKNYKNALPYGLYYISDKHKPFTIYDNKRVAFSILGKDVSGSCFYKIMGSPKLYILIERIFRRLTNLIPLFCKFKKIPQ